MMSPFDLDGPMAVNWFSISETAEQSDHFAEDPYVALPWIHDERSHGGILRLEHDALAVTQVPLHRDFAFAGRVGRDHRDDDVVRMRAVLAPHDDEVAIADVRVDHAV